MRIIESLNVILGWIKVIQVCRCLFYLFNRKKYIIEVETKGRVGWKGNEGRVEALEREKKKLKKTEKRRSSLWLWLWGCFGGGREADFDSGLPAGAEQEEFRTRYSSNNCRVPILLQENGRFFSYNIRNVVFWEASK